MQDSDELYGVISPIVEKSDNKGDYVLFKRFYITFINQVIII